MTPAAPAGLPLRDAAGEILPKAHHPLFDIARLPLFEKLAAHDLAALLETAWVQIFPDGHVLFTSGGTADKLLVVLDGHVELLVEEGGRQSVFEVAERPAMLAEAALREGVHGETARVVGHARLLVMPVEPFRRALDAQPQLARQMLSAMSMRLRGLIGQISELKLKSTTQRLAGFLLGLAPGTEDQAVVRFPYGKRLAAETLGMTAESLSRALARLGALGVESRPDNVVAIASIAALKAFVVAEDEG
jgi:CRP-like cAMP-binding protein